MPATSLQALPPGDQSAPVPRLFGRGLWALRHLRCWMTRAGGDRLVPRAVALCLLLLLLVQAVGFGAVRSSIDRNARAQLDKRAGRGRTDLAALARTERPAPAPGRVATRVRHGFPFCDGVRRCCRHRRGARQPGRTRRRHRGRVARPGAPGPGPARRSGRSRRDADRLRELAAPIARDNGAARIALLAGRPHQLVVVPVRMPATVGWICAP